MFLWLLLLVNRRRYGAEDVANRLTSFARCRVVMGDVWLVAIRRPWPAAEAGQRLVVMVRKDTDEARIA